MAGYAGLTRVTDANVRACLKTLFDLIDQQKVRIAALERTALQRGSSTTIDAGGQRVSNVADGASAGDAATVGQVRQLVDLVKKATY